MTKQSDLIRIATEEEVAKILATFRAHYKLGEDDDSTPYAIYIAPNYITDCPGYSGPVAFMHWGGAPHFVTVLTWVPVDGWGVVAELHDLGGDTSIAAPEARFMYTTLANDPTSAGQFATLAEMLDANRDDEDFCRFLRRAQLGDAYVAGGGAAPQFTTWRVA